MRCVTCNADVGEAKRCPYCGRSTDGRDGETDRQSSRVRGEFRGRLDEAEESRGRGKSLVRSLVSTVLRFLADPHTAAREKLLLLLGALYVLLPLDFLPGGLIPVIGWLDDLIVAFLVWTLIGPDLKRHYRP